MPLMRLAEVEKLDDDKINNFNNKLRKWQKENKHLPVKKYHRCKQIFITKLEVE